MPKEVAAQSAADTQILEEQARQRRQYEQRMGVSEGSSTSKGYTARSVTLHSSECSGNSSGDGTANSSTKFDGINQVFLHRPSAVERVLLVVALKYFPHEIPSRVNRGVMNNTWSRIRILAACVCWVYLLYWIEMSIRSGRAHRDDGKISLYEDVATSPQQAFKRELSKGKVRVFLCVWFPPKSIHSFPPHNTLPRCPRGVGRLSYQLLFLFMPSLKEQIDTPIIAQAWSDLKDVVNS